MASVAMTGDGLLETLLPLPAAAAIGPSMRQVLKAAAGAQDGAASEALHEPLPVLVDTLASLALLNADGEAIAATVLHALPGWSAHAEAALAKDHPAVAALLDGQRAAAQVWALHAERSGRGNAEGLRRLLLAIVRDLRVVPILLARQLAHLRAAQSLPEDEQRALAQLTRDIHAPLANRLGIWQLKWELEDLAFRYLEPATYQRIARLLDDKRVHRERYIEQVKSALDQALAAQGVRAEVAGRPKHIYSIWKKMQKKDVPIGELYDLRAVRVLVDDVPACYAALGVVHVLWAPVPSEFDDYIARPKGNDYRSLHTAVIGPEGKTLEVQIRTREMHAQAELGVAAHWRYKEGGTRKGGEGRSAAGDAALDRKIEWMRRLLEANAEAGEPSGGEPGSSEPGGSERDLRGEFDSALVEDRIYVLTPAGEVIDLPRGATPLDFAYHVHTMVGHRCRGAKVDGRIVPLDHALRTGDRVEILTGKTAEPRRDWLVAANGFLASARSREKVRNWFNKLDRVRNVQAGKDLLDKDLRRMGLLQADLAPALQKFNAGSAEELYVMVGLGDVGPHQVGRCLLEHERAAQEAQAPASQSAASLAPRAPKKPKPASAAAFTVVGVGNLLVQVARCCQPLPGEEVAGYLTRSRGVSVHRLDCSAFQRLAATQPQRVLPVEWGRAGGGHEADVLVEAIDRKWLLKDLTNLIAQEDAHVLGIHSEAGRGHGHMRLRLQLRVQDYGQLSRLLGKIDSLSGVQQARRA
jgi:GTP pyrophosphokinase